MGGSARTTLLLAAHGSASPEAVDQVCEFALVFAERVQLATTICFLEITEPDLAGGIRTAVANAGKSGRVLTLPLLLGAAGHQKNDLPVALQWARSEFPGVQFSLAAPFEPHIKLTSLLNLRAGEALADLHPKWDSREVSVLLAGRGSSDPDSNSELARSARLLYESRLYRDVEYAYQAATRPDIGEGVERLALLGGRRMVLLPNLLFSGTVEKEMSRIAAEKAECCHLEIAFARPLGIHPYLLDVVEQRLQEALSNSAGMTCDVCKFRFPFPGREEQAGSPQSSHHFHPHGG